jgi:phosphopantetheinyl transferase
MMNEVPTGPVEAFVVTPVPARSGELLIDLLSAGEVERCRTYRFESDAAAFALRRVLLRHVVSRRLDVPYGNVIVKERTAGGLDVSVPRQRSSLFASLSGSRSAVACAVSGSSIGIDVEPIRNLPDLASLAKASMAESERREIFAADEAATCFLKHWTLKEAYLKALGCGLSEDPRIVEFSISATGAVLKSSSKLDRPPRDWLFTVNVERECVVAIASHGAMHPILRYVPGPSCLSALAEARSATQLHETHAL